MKDYQKMIMWVLLGITTTTSINIRILFDKVKILEEKVQVLEERNK